MKELVAGSTLWLPVFVPGGMLALGDCHAVVGDGAVAGTGAECSSDTHIRVTVEKGSGITSPRALTPDHFVVLSHGQDLGVWPESHWPGFALRQADVFQSYTAW